MTAMDQGARAGDGESIWAGETGHPLSDETIEAVLARRAAATPARVAVTYWPTEAGNDVEPACSITYAQLYEATRCAADDLLRTARPGDRIGIWASNSCAWVVIELAAAVAGLVLVPINPACTEHEVAEMLRRSCCVMVFAERHFRGRNLLDTARGLVARLPDLVVAADVSRWRDELPSRGAIRRRAVDTRSAFLIQYTSGTTGVPKGAMLSQHTALNVGALTAALMDLPDAVVWCSPMPLHHVGGSVCVLFTVLAAGGTLVLLSSFNAGTLLAAVEQTRSAVLGAVPTMLLTLLDHPDRTRRDLTSLRFICTGGSAVAPALIRRVEEGFGASVINAYGQSEAPTCVQTRIEDSAEVKAMTIGRPGLHRQGRIVNPDTGVTVALNQPGELWIKSPLLMSGYFDDPVQSALTLDADGWLQTGDLCSMDDDGIITIRGRLREVIIRGGENVYPAEVEDALLRHPAIADVAVVGAPDERWGEQVAAFVRFRPASEVAWQVLEEHARDLIAGFKVPRVWRSMDQFPTTASGKVQKFRLRQMLTDTSEC